MASTTTNPAKYQPIKNHHQCGFNPGHDKCHVRITVVVRIKKATAPTAPVDNANNRSDYQPGLLARQSMA